MKFSKNAITLLSSLVLINLLSIWFFKRVDLTEEKRYSISDASRSLVQRLPEPLEIEVLLDGDGLPGGFERLKQAVSETLDEYKTYGGAMVNYSFFDPNSITNPEERGAYIDSLVSMGVQPTNVFDTEGGKKTETLVFPYALVRSAGRVEAVPLLKGNQALSAQEKLNQSYENLEYSFSKVFRSLSSSEKKKVGLLTQFTNLQPINFAGLITSLQENYDLYVVDAQSSESFLGLDALILPKPDIRVDDSTKYKIDQYIMYGGHALFFMDGLQIDSIGLEGTFAQPYDSNIDDLLFRYGIRLNKDLVKDGASAAMVPLVVGEMGGEPNIQPIAYRFFPMINNFGNSVITRNIDIVSSKFASTLDTVKAAGVKKTPLLMTTPYTKTLTAPALVTYNDARKDTDVEEYNGGVKTIGYLLEGRFSSLYKNRILPSDPRSEHFKPESEQTKIVVCSDGDLVVNDIDRRNGEPLPLGFDKLSKHTFGNQDFVLNAVDYLIDEDGVITARNKEVKLRPLDTIKTRDNRLQIQLINVLLPIGIVLILGLARNWFYRRRFI